jgi:hypothetical protein
MVSTVLSIINSARGRGGLGKSPLTASQFDAIGNVDKDITTLKTEFARLYKELALMKKEDFRQLFTVTTAIGVNEYSLTFDPNQIVEMDLRVINIANSAPWIVNYVSETDVLNRYPDADLIPSGRPYQWWIKSTTNQQIKKLAFVGIPDAVYTIEGFQNVRAETLTANLATKCVQEGDLWLEDKLYEMMLMSFGLIDGYTEQYSHNSKMKYIGQGNSQELQGEAYFPAQDGLNQRDFVVWR